MHDQTLERRQFLKSLGIVATGVVLGRSGAVLGQSATSLGSASVPQRKFGRHDFTLSALGLGGHALASAASEAESMRIVDEAIAAGINFMDNAWDYHNGRGEEVMGRVLKGRRDKVFLMTKLCTHGKGGRKEVMQFLDQSLQRLQTDHLDLWQLHAVATMAQVEHAFNGGVIEAMEEARKQGKVRFLGFTGHTEPDVHLAMLAHKYPFDTCQFPLSPIDANSDAFQRKVLPEVLKQGIAPLAMKTLGGNASSINDGVMTVQEALRYTLTLPVALIVSGIASVEQLRQNAQIAKEFAPMKAEEMVALEQRCRSAAEGQKYEPYRKWTGYQDGDSIRYV